LSPSPESIAIAGTAGFSSEEEEATVKSRSGSAFTNHEITNPRAMKTAAHRNTLSTPDTMPLR
jgi:hypothetical protein